MENCLIIINKSAGSADKISFDIVKKVLGARYKYACHTLPADGKPHLDDYDALAVCGGDGTLSTVLDEVHDAKKDVYYFPYGTLNDKAKAGRSKHTKIWTKTQNKTKSAESRESRAVVGVVKEKEKSTVFSYVFAAGTFTPIGYKTSVKMKKKFGVLAYLAEVVKEYKVTRIAATVTADGKTYEGEWALIMFIKSPRCFGFKFNKAYDGDDVSGHLILIRSPKHGGIIGKIETFFPFFRVFFMGLKNEREGKIVFKKFNRLNATFDLPTDFCKDGEKASIDGNIAVEFERTECRLNLML